MKKIIFALFFAFFLMFFCAHISCAAAEEALLSETKNITAPFGFRLFDAINNVLSGEINFTFRGMIEWLFLRFTSSVRENFPDIFKLTMVGILSGICTLFVGEEHEIGTFASVSVAALLAMKTFSSALICVRETIDEMFLFVSSFIPTLSALNGALMQSGQTALCKTVFVSMQVFIYLCKEIILPFSVVILVFSVSDKLSENGCLFGVTNLLKQGFRWTTGLLLTFYGAVLALQSYSAGTFDTFAGKTVKYAVGSFVPVLGSALSESLEMVLKSAKAIKSALGIGGILGVCCVVITPLLRVSALAIGLKISSCIFSLTSEKRVSGVVQEISAGLLRVLGVLLSVCVMFLISIFMLCMLAKGG